MGWRLFAILWTFLLVSTLAGPPRARAVTYDFDQQNRLTRVARENGTLIEYTYGRVGTRLSRNILSPRLPDISFDLFWDRHFLAKVGFQPQEHPEEGVNRWIL